MSLGTRIDIGKVINGIFSRDLQVADFILQFVSRIFQNIAIQRYIGLEFYRSLYVRIFVT